VLLGCTWVLSAGCGRSLPTGNLPPPPPPSQETITSVNLLLTADSKDDIVGAEVIALGPTPLDSVLLSADASSVLVSLSGLASGSYTIVVKKTGYTTQSVPFLISGAVAPTAGVVLEKIEAGSELMTVVQQAIPDGSVPTSIPIDAPTIVTDYRAAVPAAVVTLEQATGSFVFAHMAPNAAPPVVQGHEIQQSVLAAVYIDAPDRIAGAVVGVKLPVPLVSASEYASAAGDSVDVLSYDYTAYTWQTEGRVPIDSNGFASASLRGLSGENLIAIATYPEVRTFSTVETFLQTLSPDAIDAMVAAGLTAYTYKPSAWVTITAAKPAASVSSAKAIASDAPPGMDRFSWGLVKANLMGALRTAYKSYSDDISGDAMAGIMMGVAGTVDVALPDAQAKIVRKLLE